MISLPELAEATRAGIRETATHPAQNEDTLATAAKSSGPSWVPEQNAAPQRPPPPSRTESESRLKSTAPDVRRKFERKDINLDVSLYSDSNFYAGFTENLSAGGVFIATHNLLKIGEKIDITITMPTEKQVVAHGIVRWLREYNEASDSPPGMGIQFISIEGEDLIKDFLAARAPLFYDDE